MVARATPGCHPGHPGEGRATSRDEIRVIPDGTRRLEQAIIAADGREAGGGHRRARAPFPRRGRGSRTRASPFPARSAAASPARPREGRGGCGRRARRSLGHPRARGTAPARDRRVLVRRDRVGGRHRKWLDQPVRGSRRHDRPRIDRRDGRVRRPVDRRSARRRRAFARRAVHRTNQPSAVDEAIPQHRVDPGIRLPRDRRGDPRRPARDLGARPVPGRRAHRARRVALPARPSGTLGGCGRGKNGGGQPDGRRRLRPVDDGGGSVRRPRADRRLRGSRCDRLRGPADVRAGGVGLGRARPRYGDGATFIVHAEVGLGDVNVYRYAPTKRQMREIRQEERRAEREEAAA